MTMILQCKGTITDQNAPFLNIYDDIDSKSGSLFLWDAGLQSTDFTIGAEIPNLLESYPLASGKKFILEKGSADQTQHDLQLKIQKTSKGGLHLIGAQASSVSSSGSPVFYALKSQAELNEYLFNQLKSNPNLYVSVWQRLTRKATDAVGMYSPNLIYAASNTANSVFEMGKNSTTPSVSTTSVKEAKITTSAIDDLTVGKENLIKMNILGERGTGLDLNTRAMYFGTGALPPYSRSQTFNTIQSLIIYRIYVEDLNASGRTYEQVKAIDDAEFEKAFAVGGRFHGDAWSDPITVLP